MTTWICATCGNQHGDTPQPPAECVVCADERQYVPPAGQHWTSLAELSAVGHRGEIRELEPDLYGLGVTPSFAIGQRGLVQCGGHFAGSAVGHWAAGAEGNGALLVGDTMTVTPGADRVAIMRSYPNYLPLPEFSVRSVVERVACYRYDRIYGGWWDDIIGADAPEVVRRSVERSLAWQRGEATEDAPPAGS